MQTSQFTWIDAFDDAVLPPLLSELHEARLEKKNFLEQQAIHRKYRPQGAGNIYYRVYQTADGFLAVGALSHALRIKFLAATGLVDSASAPTAPSTSPPKAGTLKAPSSSSGPRRSS
jgi:hypothetical protein